MNVHICILYIHMCVCVCMDIYNLLNPPSVACIYVCLVLIT